VRDGIGNQLAGQQDGIVSHRASVQHVPYEQTRPRHLANGPGKDSPPGPDHCRRSHAARPVPPHTRHSVRARRSNAHSPASPTASSQRRRPRYFQPRPPQLPHEPSSPGVAAAPAPAFS
jgi:hypothetical protein